MTFLAETFGDISNSNHVADTLKYKMLDPSCDGRIELFFPIPASAPQLVLHKNVLSFLWIGAYERFHATN